MSLETFIMPTGHCFDDALDLICQLLQGAETPEALADRLMLVHGICLAPDGHPYAHAWVEDEDRCLFRGVLAGEAHSFAAHHAEYYAEARVQEVTRYSVRDAWAANRRHGTYGPWVPRYKALCTQKQGAGRQETGPSR